MKNEYVPPPDMTSMQELPKMPEDACEDPEMEPLAWFGVVVAIVMVFAFAYAFATEVWGLCQ